MKSMQSILKSFSDVLAQINGVNIYHYWRPKMQAPFCVWAEQNEGEPSYAGNKKIEKQFEGTLDYFTQTEFDPIVDEIVTAFESIDGLSYMLESVQYEDDTQLIHYTYSWSIV